MRSRASTELRIEGGSALPAFTHGRAPEGTGLAVAGDWNGDGRDTVGVYVRDEARFRLSGPDPADPDFGATTLPTGERPAADLVAVVGDWNGLDVVTLEDLRAIFGPLEDEVAVKAQMPLLNDAMRRSDATTPARPAPPPPPGRPPYARRPGAAARRASRDGDGKLPAPAFDPRPV